MAGIMTILRDHVTIRPLTLVESLRTAELQALALLKFSGIAEPPVPVSVITQIERMQVEYVSLGTISGAAQWVSGRWLILVNRKDVRGRQRMTLAHEFKHILDNPFISVLYPSYCTLGRHERQELVCEYFAGCLLMPRAWLEAAWHAGVRDVRELAARFDVSLLAMRVRLMQIGLLERVATNETEA
ncbi:hypothetical protein GCM10009682_16250 [Luedemannella flava]|uniref:IrrE N-terminal-like domain-containing protein n=1 Tax=Luedemannella flava TaxID=349316 RepID=A0ABN2LNZ8_9ACTN